ncbi:hypothetical protein CVS30_11535 [Arthrobacter psychrolactophilus]|uniref:Uncharacterized protein n=1 Tax=Arthrobacter psychrolactophilus TaxID=92442 RepID=A0A2V5IS31_9MICC|nr:hypothetical protein [Arthrobacter psychrolactophilus]PYI38182.1 hypothetical protein CVS30_11535 [Arthrobacter psychrolactophilus]
MSKETEPIRSRRELRAQSAQAASAAAKPPVPLSPAAQAPAEAVAPGENASASVAPPVPASRPEPHAHRAERQSQTRARDRAALRAYKELIDPPGLSPLPSRRTIRQSQLDAERAPVTAVNPVVPAKTPTPAPKTPIAAEPVVAQQPVEASPAPAAAQPTRVGRRAAVVRANRGLPASQPVASPAPRPTPEPTPVPAAEAPAVLAPADEAAAAEPEAPATILNAEAPAAPEVAAVTEEVAADPAATHPPLPGLVAGGSYYPVSAGPPAAAVAPSTEELRILAAQRAEAERAAILAERAQARERLAQESAKNRRPASDPTATNNLAMVTPLDFIEVPGADRPILRQPTTTHVPIVANAAIRGASKRPGTTTKQTATPKLPPTPTASTPVQDTTATVPNVRADRFDAALTARTVPRPTADRPVSGGRSNTLKQAEAMATGSQAAVPAEAEAAAAVQRSQMPPIPADYAHGLEPLDAMTAGLGRTQRNLLIQWGSVVAGGAAIVVGAIMFFTALAR